MGRPRGVTASVRRVGWATCFVVLCVSGAVLHRQYVSRRELVFREANAEVLALAVKAAEGVPLDELRNLAARAKHARLSQTHPERWVLFGPPSLAADEWVAWLYYRRDGSIIWVDFGTRDSPENATGQPPDRCTGSDAECTPLALMKLRRAFDGVPGRRTMQ